jgi:hypothetical protein
MPSLLLADLCCHRHNWQPVFWHTLMSWPARWHRSPHSRSTSFPPQFHRIRTWLSWISPIPKYSLRLALCFVTSHPFRNDLLPIPWTLVHITFGYWSNVRSIETSYRNFIPCSRCFIKFQLESFFLPCSLKCPSDNRTCNGRFPRSYLYFPT